MTKKIDSGRSRSAHTEALPDWERVSEEEKEKIIIPLAERKASAREISERFANCTKNAVIAFCKKRQIILRGKRTRSEVLAIANTSTLSESMLKESWTEMDMVERVLVLRYYTKIGLSVPETQKKILGSPRANIYTVCRSYGIKIRRHEARRINRKSRERTAIEPGVAPSNLTQPKISKKERKTILQLTEKTCKWPIGNPGDPEFYFCGRQVTPGSPYCEHHAKNASQPLAVPKKENRRVSKIKRF